MVEAKGRRFLADAGFGGPVSLHFGTHLTFGAYRGDARYGLFDRQLTVEGPEGVDRRELASAEELAEVLGAALE